MLGTAVIVGLLSAKSKRLGDMLAGTYSQNERVSGQPAPVFGVPYQLVEWSRTADVARMPDSLARRISQFLAQSKGLTPESRRRLSVELANEVSVYVPAARRRRPRAVPGRRIGHPPRARVRRTPAGAAHHRAPAPALEGCPPRLPRSRLTSDFSADRRFSTAGVPKNSAFAGSPIAPAVDLCERPLIVSTNCEILRRPQLFRCWAGRKIGQ